MSGKKQILNSMEDLARQLSVRVRYEKTAARGGLCFHNGQYQIIVDSKATDEFKISVIANALKTFDLSGIFISPKLRDLLDLN